MAIFRSVPGQNRQGAMCDERLTSQCRVVAPIGPTITLPPGAADGVGAHAKPHAELKDPRKRAGRRKTDDQPLENAELGIRLHDADETEDGVGSHETVGVECYREIMFAAPALAEFTDVTGLLCCFDPTPPIPHRNPASPTPGDPASPH